MPTPAEKSSALLPDVSELLMNIEGAAGLGITLPPNEISDALGQALESHNPEDWTFSADIRLMSTIAGQRVQLEELCGKLLGQRSGSVEVTAAKISAANTINVTFSCVQ